MANTSVFTGADGSITLSVPEGVEGERAQDVITAYDLINVGRVQDVTVEVVADIRPFHEIGSRYASQLRPGNIRVTGAIGRAYVNGAMLRLLLGEAFEAAPSASWPQPAFNITLQVQNPASADVRSSITLHDVKLERWTYQMPEDDFVLDRVGFQARYLTVADQA
jgi:hypothetical protein